MASNYKDVDIVSRHNGLGALSQSTANAFYGINHRGLGNALPVNTDNHGLTFFTRPRMNLSYDNIAMDRKLTPLLTDDDKSLQRAIRVLLDPVGVSDVARVRSNDGRTVREHALRTTTSKLVDPRSPFIAMLSNHLISLTGWPDPGVAYFDSTPGPHREVWSMIDDAVNNYGAFDLTATFRNTAGDPITLLFNTWIRYASLVYQGVLMPYPDSIIENEIDYNTRIYRLVLDPTRQFVQKIAACGAAFPYSSALGSAFDFASDTPYVADRATQISIPFHCNGAEYQDPILIREFNDIVFLFNPDMGTRARKEKMRKLSYKELRFFNYYGYPYIHPRSLELEWWVYNDDYKAIMAQMSTLGPAANYPDQQNTITREGSAALLNTQSGYASALKPSGEGQP